MPNLVCAERTNICVVRCANGDECRDHGLAGQRGLDDMNRPCAGSDAPEGACFCSNPACEGT